MKPQSLISPQPKSVRGESRRSGVASRQPATSYHYLETNGDFYGRDADRKLATPSRTSSFQDLSNDFLGSEMKRDYLAEAVFFAIFVAVSVWPIASMLRALAALAK